MMFKAVREIIYYAALAFVGGLTFLLLGLVMLLGGSTIEHATNTLIGVAAVAVGIMALGLTAGQAMAAKKSHEQAEETNRLLRQIRDRHRPPLSD